MRFVYFQCDILKFPYVTSNAERLDPPLFTRLDPSCHNTWFLFCHNTWFLSVESPTNQMSVAQSLFLGGSGHRDVAPTRLTVPKNTLGHRRHSPKKGRLRCQAINLDPPRRVGASRMLVLVCPTWMPVFQNPCQTPLADCLWNWDIPDWIHVLTDMANWGVSQWMVLQYLCCIPLRSNILNCCPTCTSKTEVVFFLPHQML